LNNQLPQSILNEKNIEITILIGVLIVSNKTFQQSSIFYQNDSLNPKIIRITRTPDS